VYRGGFLQAMSLPGGRDVLCLSGVLEIPIDGPIGAPAAADGDGTPGAAHDGPTASAQTPGTARPQFRRKSTTVAAAASTKPPVSAIKARSIQIGTAVGLLYANFKTQRNKNTSHLSDAVKASAPLGKSSAPQL